MSKGSDYACQPSTGTLSTAFCYIHELNLESLERCRGIARLCLLFKIINSICYFNSNVFNFCNTRTYHSHSLSLIPPFSRTNSYFHSFVPNTVYMWNMLDMSVVSAPSLHHFKSLL